MLQSIFSSVRDPLSVRHAPLMHTYDFWFSMIVHPVFSVGTESCDETAVMIKQTKKIIENLSSCVRRLSHTQAFRSYLWLRMPVFWHLKHCIYLLTGFLYNHRQKKSSGFVTKLLCLKRITDKQEMHLFHSLTCECLQTLLHHDI